MRPRPCSHSLLMVLAALVLTAAPAAAGTIEGRWRLVEPGSEPLTLELALSGPRVSGTLRLGPGRASARPWPALIVDDRAFPVEVRELWSSLAADRVHARYEVEHPSRDGTRLVVTEEYAVDESDALVGTVEVGVVRDGVPGGSYTLKRRFERQP